MSSVTRLMVAPLAIVLVVACGGKKAPEQPAPQPTNQPTQPAPTPSQPAPAPSQPSAPAEDPAAAAAKITAALLGEVGTMIHFDFDASDIRAEDQVATRNAGENRETVVRSDETTVQVHTGTRPLDRNGPMMPGA